jgi:nitroreductase
VGARPNQALQQTAGHDGFPRFVGSAAPPLLILVVSPLALTARGLGTCVEVSIAGYPEIVRAQLAIPAELSILCGLAVGYAEPDFPANKLHIGREAIEKNVVFLDN